MSLALARLLREQAGPIGPALLPSGAPLRFALINGAPSVRSKLVYLFWTGSRPLPAFVVKSTRQARYNALLDQEAAALACLQAWLPPGPPRVPRPLLHSAHDGRTVTAETFLPGRRLRDVLRARPGAAPRHLRGVDALVPWLAAFHARSARPADAGDLEAHVFRPLREAPSGLALSPGERASLAAITAQARALAGRAPLPLVFAHHDLGPHNVVVDSDGRFAGVIDWEDGAVGLPAGDLFFFLTAFAAEARSRAGPGGDQPFFFGQAQPADVAASLAGRWLGAYCRSVGLAPAWLRPLLALHWLWHIAAENRYRTALRTEGYVLDGGPSHVLAVPLAAESAPSAYQRRLRFLLQHLDAFAPGAGA